MIDKSLIPFAAIVAELSTADADKLQFSLVLEPDSLGNVVTNMSVDKCANAASAYKEGISYVGSPSSTPLWQDC